MVVFRDFINGHESNKKRIGFGPGAPASYAGNAPTWLRHRPRKLQNRIRRPLLSPFRIAEIVDSYSPPSRE